MGEFTSFYKVVEANPTLATIVVLLAVAVAAFRFIAIPWWDRQDRKAAAERKDELMREKLRRDSDVAIRDTMRLLADTLEKHGGPIKLKGITHALHTDESAAAPSPNGL